MKALALDQLAPADRDVCKALAGLGVVFDTAKLIANEFNAHGPSTYFGICSCLFILHELSRLYELACSAWNPMVICMRLAINIPILLYLN